MNVLGISCFYHDSAAALLQNGDVVAAAQEERFTRLKHDPGFPYHAIQYCMETAGIAPQDLDHVIFYDKPFLKFERLMETYMAFAPRGFKSFAKALPVWCKEKLLFRNLLMKELNKIAKIDWNSKLLFSEHHLSHAASAFYPSPFDEALVLTMDGVGEWTTTSVAIGRGSDLKVVKEIRFPHSLGLLYSAFTYYTGFRVNSGEYKLMGLAPYGEPKYVDVITKNLLDIKEDGTFRLDLSYFDYCTGLTMTNKKFDKLFGQPRRVPDQDELTQFHMDIAASIQKVVEDIVLQLVRSLMAEHKINRLCLAGGVALNCVANGKILQIPELEDLWIQPAAGDAGGALGAAYCAYHLFKKKARVVRSTDAMKGSYLGPEYSPAEIEERLTRIGARFEAFKGDDLFEKVADDLANGEAYGWFQGRMEFGPRALGGRSIIADPRSKTMQKNLNLKVKFRESFRPFAPSVMREHVGDWFEIDNESPYMLLVSGVKDDRRRSMSQEEQELFGIDKLNVPRSDIPAVTHVDYSARVQTVEERTNQRYYRLLDKFNQKTGCPVLVNTSFNVRGEPIVCTPEDAFRCFMGTGLDGLVVGDYVLKKSNQDQRLALDYKDSFKLD